MKCVTIEFNYITVSPALLGCRRSRFVSDNCTFAALTDVSSIDKRKGRHSLRVKLSLQNTIELTLTQSADGG